MKKKYFFRFTAIGLSFFISTFCNAQQVHIEKDNYTINFTCFIENNTALARCYSVTSRFNGSYVKNVVFPEYVTASGNDYKVTEIGTQACDADRIKELRLQKVNLPKTIESIGDYAFRKCLCNSIVLPERLQRIGEYAFMQSQLSFVEIPKNVKSIGTGAFQNCKIDTVIVNNSSVFGHDVFSGNNNLKTIIYCDKAPDNWVAVNNTYVPDLTSYSSPSSFIGVYHIYEMISWEQTEFDYSGSTHIPKYTNNVKGYSVTLDFAHLHKDAGTWCDTISAKYIDNNNGHHFSARIPFHYTIKPQKLVVSVESTRRMYGDDNPQFKITYSGFINGENENVFITNPTISTTATKWSGVGEYPITISGGEAQNYTFVYEPGVLTINKALLTAKVNDETRQYGNDNPSFTVSYTGLKNNETVPEWTEELKIETSATKKSYVGMYAIFATGVPTNYDLPIFENGTLTVTPAPLTIKANNDTRQYYSDEPNFSFTCDGFVNGDNESSLSSMPKITTSANLDSNVGTYDIIVSDASNRNYSISYVNGVLTITPRTLIASVDNYERLYNEDNPEFEVFYEGFVGEENEEVLKVKPIASTTATKTSDVGTYPITVIGGSADNYTFSYIDGVLNINKAEQTITWEQDLSKLIKGDQIELKAESTSGLPITYTLDNNSIAEIYSAGSKFYLDCKAEGEAQILAVQEGNRNYYSSSRIRKSVNIYDASAIDDTKSSSIAIQSMPFGISVSNANVGEMIKVYSTDGLLQKSVKTVSQVTFIPLKNGRIYIIKVGGKTVKLKF